MTDCEQIWNTLCFYIKAIILEKKREKSMKIMFARKCNAIISILLLKKMRKEAVFTICAFQIKKKYGWFITKDTYHFFLINNVTIEKKKDISKERFPKKKYYIYFLCIEKIDVLCLHQMNAIVFFYTQIPSAPHSPAPGQKHYNTSNMCA